MDSIGQTWRSFYQQILSVSPMWWSIIVVAVILCFFAYLMSRGR